ncbi:hypothetical protein D5F52_26550 (plasmid) [Brevibacillus laterosporus]|nr:hypothetical protein D5F52_26550 [Brevibacillus laterosporus]
MVETFWVFYQFVHTYKKFSYTCQRFLDLLEVWIHIVTKKPNTDFVIVRVDKGEFRDYSFVVFEAVKRVFVKRTIFVIVGLVRAEFRDHSFCGI